MSAKGPPAGPQLEIVAGSQRHFSFDLYYEGGLLPVTGAVWFNVGYTVTDGAQVGEVLCRRHSDVNAELQIVDGPTGSIRVSFLSADTLGAAATIPAGKYYYDLWSEINDEPTAHLSASPFIVRPGVGPGTY